MKRRMRNRWTRWRQYEAEKKAIAARGLSAEEYEKAIQQLARKYKL